MKYHSLEKIDQLHDGYRKAFEINGQDLLLLQHEGERYLLENLCPHAAWLLTDAKIIGSDLRCSMHGYRFDLKTGACTYYTEGPCRGLHAYELVYHEDEVGVEI